jgi:protein-S-isoprenylcysteine O-methyltransferase Ste14
MRRAAIIGIFVVLAGVTVLGAARALAHALEDPGQRAWLLAAYRALKATIICAFAAFVVLRAPARRSVRDPLALTACAAAVVATMALKAFTGSTSTGVVLAGEAVAVVGCGWLLASALALGRCFSVLPDVRGLVTRGPYRLVRHPVYLGELTVCAGLVIAAPSGWNLTLAAGFGLAQGIRMKIEERALTEEFPEYEDYAATTARIVPGLRLGARRAQVSEVEA